jgi:hypothetical protein
MPEVLASEPSKWNKASCVSGPCASGWPSRVKAYAPPPLELPTAKVYHPELNHVALRFTLATNPELKLGTEAIPVA